MYAANFLTWCCYLQTAPLYGSLGLQQWRHDMDNMETAAAFLPLSAGTHQSLVDSTYTGPVMRNFDDAAVNRNKIWTGR